MSVVTHLYTHTCAASYMVEEARLVSSCLSFPSSARPLFSRFLSSVGVRVYTLQNVELDETWSLRTGHAAVNQRLRSILPKDFETPPILHRFKLWYLKLCSFLAVGILFLQLKQENDTSSKILGRKQTYSASSWATGHLYWAVLNRQMSAY